MKNKYNAYVIIHAIILLSLGIVTGCQDASSEALQCTSTADCYTGEMCRHARCVLLSQEVSQDSNGEAPSSTQDTGSTSSALPPGPEQRSPEAGPLDMRSPGLTDLSDSMDMGSPPRAWVDQDPNYGVGMPGVDMAGAEDVVEPCEGIAPMVGELIINELLMNVPAGEQGDANADGTRDAYDDEFVELVNISELALSLEGVELMVNDNVRHAFGELCLQPGQTIVIFSGPRGRVTTWRDEVVFMAPDSKLGLSNSSGKVELWDEFDRVLFSFSYESARKTSYVLWPELSGDTFVAHDSISPDLFSPGRCANGLALATRCGEDDTLMSGD